MAKFFARRICAAHGSASSPRSGDSNAPIDMLRAFLVREISTDMFGANIPSILCVIRGRVCCVIVCMCAGRSSGCFAPTSTIVQANSASMHHVMHHVMRY